MAIITISRGIFSGGESVAQCLAERMGYCCLDREELLAKAAVIGVSEGKLREALMSSPSALGRLSRQRRLYLLALQAALAEEAAGDDLVYHGNAGHLLLKDVVPVLRVKIIAPLEFRLAALRDRLQLGPAEGEAYLARQDDERRKWTRFLYGVEWDDPTLYDVVINLDRTGLEEACELIADMAGLRGFALTLQRQLAIRDFALASRVRAALGLDTQTAHLDVQVLTKAGRVLIQGFVGSDRSLHEVARVVRQVPGALEVSLDELTVYHDV
jgi:cytidylate kinase